LGKILHCLVARCRAHRQAILASFARASCTSGRPVLLLMGETEKEGSEKGAGCRAGGKRREDTRRGNTILSLKSSKGRLGGEAPKQGRTRIQCGKTTTAESKLRGSWGGWPSSQGGGGDAQERK